MCTSTRIVCVMHFIPYEHILTRVIEPLADVPASTVINYSLDKTNQLSASQLPAMGLFKTYRAKYDDTVQDRHLKVFINIICASIIGLKL